MTVHEVETFWLFSKEIVPGAEVNKEDHAEIIMGQKGTITIEFLEKCATVNHASNG